LRKKKIQLKKNGDPRQRAVMGKKADGKGAAREKKMKKQNRGPKQG